MMRMCKMGEHLLHPAEKICPTCDDRRRQLRKQWKIQNRCKLTPEQEDALKIECARYGAF
jgi:hypothetical protein